MTIPISRRRRDYVDCPVTDDNIALALEESEPSKVRGAYTFPTTTPSRDARQLLALESIAKSLECLAALAEKAAR